MAVRYALIRARLAPGLLCAVLLGACGGGGGSSPAPAPLPVPVPVPAPLPGTLADPVQYSGDASAALATAQESAAVVAQHITLSGKVLDFTSTTGHLTASDAKTGQATASFFYVAYTAGSLDAAKRPLTFFYNGGPGSASLWLHLGSFGPRRIVTGIPGTAIPNPTEVVDNQETLLDHSDLVFVDAVGTGYSQAVAPHTNAEFWGVDSDAAAFRDFVRRYVAVNKREASPKYLFGESYGAPRSGVLANLLEVAGVHLAGVVLQSAIMDYNSNCGVFVPGTLSCEGYIPSYAAVGAYFKVANPLPSDLTSYLQQARDFAAAQYRPAATAFLGSSHTPPPLAVATQLAALTGVPSATWSQNLALSPDQFRANLVAGRMIGRYDARVDAALGSPLTVDGDPSLTVIAASFASTISSYIKGELRYSAGSGYLASTEIISHWNFSHDGKKVPDTIPDLAAAMTINPALKILALGGYYDLATPFHQTELDLARLGSNPNIQIRNVGSGHMAYLDDAARKLERADLLNLYNSESVSK